LRRKRRERAVVVGIATKRTRAFAFVARDRAIVVASVEGA